MRFFQGGLEEWNAMIARLPNPHLLQTWEWAQVKRAYGWEPIPLIWNDASQAATAVYAAAMVLKRQILRRAFAARLSILYVPKGPLLDWSQEGCRKAVLSDLQRLAKSHGAVFLKLDPDVVVGTGIPGERGAAESAAGRSVETELRQMGWSFAADQIQFKNTVLIDLKQPEEEILARMGQKTRYNIRLATKKGVAVRDAGVGDLSLLYRMYAETSDRDGFVIRGEAYYRRVWTTFMENGARNGDPAAEALIAEVEGQPVAALWVFRFARRAYYLYGMSRQAHREKMPNHLLQWEAIRRARARGCEVYDLWGAPNVFDATDSMWGVFRFKQGLGGEIVRTLGAWDYPARPFWYKTYTGIVPRLLDVMRRQGRERTRRDLAVT